MTTGLEKIAIKSQSDRNLVFTSLAHHISTELMQESLKKIKASSARGIDKEDVKTARETFSDWWPKMNTQIHQRGYKPPAVKRVYIPKPGKSVKRPIGIPTVKDRVLQKSVSDVLSSIYEQDFLDSSFGGRRKRSAHMAVSTLRETIWKKPVNFILEADLENFFGNLDHGWVIKFLKHRVEDPRIISLIQRWLKAGIMDKDVLIDNDSGIAQGGPISVLISNIYLHYVLDLWIEKVVKTYMKGEMSYVRYLDDFVLCFQFKSDAIRMQEILTKRLEKFSLKLEPTKTKLIEFGRYARRNAQLKKTKVDTMYFLGFTLYCGLSNKGRFVVKLKTERSRLRRSHAKIKEKIIKIRHLPIELQRRMINLFLVGHYRYYGLSSNIYSLDKLYRFTLHFWKKSLSRRSQKGKIGWDKFKLMLKYFPLQKPKIYVGFSDMSKMALL